MGLFVLPEGESKQDLIKHIKASLDLWEHHELATHILEMAQTSFDSLKAYSKEKDDENTAKNDAYFMLKKTYKICSNCEHQKFREREEIKSPKDAQYCDIHDYDYFFSHLRKSFKEVDVDGPCIDFKREEIK